MRFFFKINLLHPRVSLKKNIFFNMEFNKIHNNPQNILNPFNENKKLDYFMMGNGYQKYVKYFLENYVAQSDNGIIFEEMNIDQNQIGIDSIEKDMTLIEDNKIMARICFYINKDINIQIKF